MLRFIHTLAVAAVLSLAGASAALAAAADYAFEAVTKEIPAALGATIDVRMVHKPTGKPAEHAVIFESQLDRSPDGIAVVTHPTPADEVSPGVYRFRGDLSEAGRWALKLQAKVPGEEEIIPGKVIIVAIPR